MCPRDQRQHQSANVSNGLKIPKLDFLEVGPFSVVVSFIVLF